MGRDGQSPRAARGSRRGVGDSADPESPEGQSARDKQGGVGLLQKGDRPLRGGRRAVSGRSAAGARGRAPGGRAARPGALLSPGCGLTCGGWAGRGAAQQRGPRFRVGGGR